VRISCARAVVTPSSAGWVISRHPAHPALGSETYFIAAQDATAPRAGRAKNTYVPEDPDEARVITSRRVTLGRLSPGRWGHRP
jgi:hypothetical protein